MVLDRRPMIEYVVQALRPRWLRFSSPPTATRRVIHGCAVPLWSRTGWKVSPGAWPAWPARCRPTTLYALAVPCDSPFVPPDLADRLLDALLGRAAEVAVPHDSERLQPVFALMRRDLLPSIDAYLQAGERRVDRWYARHRRVPVHMSDVPEAFVNVNTPEDMAALERRLARASAC